MQQKFQSCWSLFGDGLGSGDLGLRRGMSLFGCLTIPLNSFDTILRNISTIIVHLAQIELGIGIALFRRFIILLCIFRIFLYDDFIIFIFFLLTYIRLFTHKFI